MSLSQLMFSNKLFPVSFTAHTNKILIKAQQKYTEAWPDNIAVCFKSLFYYTRARKSDIWGKVVIAKTLHFVLPVDI